MKIEFELSGRKVIAIIIGASALWFGGWQMTRLVQDSEGRVTPKRGNISSTTASSSSEMDSQAKNVQVSLEEAFSMLKENPASLDPNKIKGAITTLEKSLQLDPENDQTVLALADLAFTGKDFSRAFYNLEKYNIRHPEDFDVKAKIGSALTMLDRNGEAISILREVVTSSPTNFKGNAYLAIALGKEGRLDEAKAYMETAIAKAPTEEAASRLRGFFQAHNSFSSASASPSTLDGWLHEHPIIGPKLQNVKVSGVELLITIKDFPMDKMPPAMRDSFIGKLWDKTEQTIKEIRFLDADTQKIIYETKR